MIKNLSLIFATCLTVIYSSFLYASSVHCPSPKEIKKLPFDIVQKGEHESIWVLLQKNHAYGTALKWNFSLTVEADNENDAKKFANAVLKKLHPANKPEQTDKVWTCDYKIRKPGLAAVAYTIN